jgi:hypothetical protein
LIVSLIVTCAVAISTLVMLASVTVATAGRARLPRDQAAEVRARER